MRVSRRFETLLSGWLDIVQRGVSEPLLALLCRLAWRLNDCRLVRVVVHRVAHSLLVVSEFLVD